MKLLKISLDSNTFGIVDFNDWLAEHKNVLDVKLSVVAALEVFHWYNTRGLSRDEFELDMKSIGASIDGLQIEDIFTTSNSAKHSDLRFKHHARDFIIGTHAIENSTALLTYNIKHFNWITKVDVMTPDQFVLLVDDNKSFEASA